MQKLLEPQIKAILINYLLKKIGDQEESVIINEFTIEKSARRVDLAVVSESSLEAFEIKSEADSLNRLKGQTDKYLEYFDKVTIVSATKHLGKIQRHIEKNVGLWTLDGEILKEIRKGKKIKIKSKQNLLNLMTAKELKKLLKDFKKKSASDKRKDLEKALFDISIEQLRKAATANIIKRYNSNYANFLKKTSGREICASDLTFLSKHKKIQNLKEDESIESLISGLSSIYIDA